jgi:hypothetical protein
MYFDMLYIQRHCLAKKDLHNKVYMKEWMNQNDVLLPLSQNNDSNFKLHSYRVQQDCYLLLIVIKWIQQFPLKQW